MKNDGTLASLQQKWFGQSFVDLLPTKRPLGMNIHKVSYNGFHFHNGTDAPAFAGAFVDDTIKYYWIFNRNYSRCPIWNTESL